MTDPENCEHYYEYKDPLTSKCKHCGNEVDNGVVDFLHRKLVEKRNQ